jgi:outer membrane putative beta-barrel porin/alpha-amylase
MKHLCGWCLWTLLVLGLPFRCFGQDLEPRRWSHLPTGTNFAGCGYAYSEADISLDPVLRIENAEMEMYTWAVKYIHTVELFQKSARLDFTQGYHEGRWSGLLDGVPRSIKRSGLSDAMMRLAINLYGAPPLRGKEFAAYRAKVDVETIVGTALVVQLPTGEYMDDKLINLGTNRFTFRPQIGMLHQRGKWLMELTGAVWLDTDNDDFFDGNKLEKDPLYTIQTHLVYNYRPGFWAAASAGYGYGGESTINGEEKDDRRESLAWALSLSYPIMRRMGVKVSYLGTRTQESVGLDSDSIVVGCSVFW